MGLPNGRETPIRSKTSYQTEGNPKPEENGATERRDVPRRRKAGLPNGRETPIRREIPNRRRTALQNAGTSQGGGKRRRPTAGIRAPEEIVRTRQLPPVSVRSFSQTLTTRHIFRENRHCVRLVSARPPEASSLDGEQREGAHDSKQQRNGAQAGQVQRKKSPGTAAPLVAGRFIEVAGITPRLEAAGQPGEAGHQQHGYQYPRSTEIRIEPAPDC